MAEYKLNLSEDPEEETKQKVIDEISQFIGQMDLTSMIVVTLTDEQSSCWDEEGDIDYQDQYGQQIIQQLDDEESDSLLIRNSQNLPVALAVMNENGGWQAIAIDKRLRQGFVEALTVAEEELENY
ncbi:MAG: hypothetical protein HON94_05275 [Methylococcales bacterium]|jgi:hypothetical protein|nr:hypothetical protein [Methylococcales bacterium]